MNVKELKVLAKKRGLRGYSKLRKSELQKLLNVKASKKPIISKNMTVAELRGIAKKNGLKGYSKLKKSDLIKLLGGTDFSLGTKIVNKFSFKKDVNKFDRFDYSVFLRSLVYMYNVV